MIVLKVDFSKKLQCKYSIFASFNYNPVYVSIIKSLSKRLFDPETKQWEIAYEECYTPLISILEQNKIPYNKEGFVKSISDLIAKVEALNNPIQPTNQELDTSILNDIEFKLTPREYQKQGIVFGMQNDNFLLADLQGLGKTLQCLNIATLKRGGNKCLIIVGYDALQFNWANEVKKCTFEDAYVLGQRPLKSGKNKGKLRKGTIKERAEDLQKLNEIEPFFIITSVATLRENIKSKYVNKKGKEITSYDFYIAEMIEQWCKNGEIGRVIFDEAQVVKNTTSLQTQALLKIKSAKYKIIATGTPIMNKHMDLFPIMSWLGKEHRNYFCFRDQYCVMGGFKNKQIVGNKNGAELNKRLASFMLRRKKEDVLDLPEKIIIDEILEMEGKQEVFYKKTKALAKADMIRQKGNKSALLAMLINLRKITCHPAWLDEKYKDSVKFERTHQLMDEIYQNNQKAIIFSNWATPIEKLYKELEMYNPAIITGATKDRMAEVTKFQEDESCKVILGTIGAMGTGLTLTAASNVIFLDEPWNRALKDQATDRAHRIGTKYPVNVYTLICRDTVDELVHRTVETKGLIADEVIDGISLEAIEAFLEED